MAYSVPQGGKEIFSVSAIKRHHGELMPLGNRDAVMHPPGASSNTGGNFSPTGTAVVTKTHESNLL